jgi:hypothetical protein
MRRISGAFRWWGSPAVRDGGMQLTASCGFTDSVKHDAWNAVVGYEDLENLMKP